MSASQQQFSTRLLGVIGFCTLLLTASFVGVLALVSGDIVNLLSRIPWYVVIASIAFIITILLLENADADGQAVILSAGFIGVLAFISTLLSVEGVLYAIEFPERVFVSQLVLYLFAAGLIGTGVGYWALNHWREFTRSSSSL